MATHSRHPAPAPSHFRRARRSESSLKLVSAAFFLLRELRLKRKRRHLDLAACDVGCCAAYADRGHHAVALARLRFDFASAPHCDALLDRKAIGHPAKIGLRCHGPDEGCTSAACRGIFFDAQRGCPHASIELAAIPQIPREAEDVATPRSSESYGRG